jgi:hypothetical protein
MRPEEIHMTPKLVGMLLTVAFAFVLSVTLPVKDTALQSASHDLSWSNARNTPVIVELFTSEGCSSCPPADQTLSWLKERQPIEGVEVIPLSEHVDYWNRLGWTDPYSSAAFSDRQQQYAAALKSEAYTPQMVVNGKVTFVGSDRKRALETVSSELMIPRATVTIEPIGPEKSSEENSASFSMKYQDLSRLGKGGKAVMLLAVTEDNLQSIVRSGENSGRTLTHIGVVRELRSIGTLDIEQGSVFQVQTEVKISKAWKRKDLRAIAFVQLQSNHSIVGAATVSFRSAALN